jgi:aspartyl-tRNA(Asn)/glutamyl-tRNA(Gln) amidotransferase subunit C
MAQQKISLEQVRHVARLARLELTAAEEERMQADLSAILDHVAKLEELDTSAVEPTAQVAEAGTPFRDDVVTNRPAAEEILANAPARQGTLFKVPRIIE